MACHCRMNALASPAQSTSSPKSLASKEDKTHQRKLVCFPVSTTNIIRIMLEGIETEPTQIAMCCKSVCKCIWANHVQFYFASYLYERRRRDFLLPPSISLSFHSIRKETPFIPSACLSRIRCEPKNVPLLVQIGSTNSTFCIIVWRTRHSQIHLQLLLGKRGRRYWGRRKGTSSSQIGRLNRISTYEHFFAEIYLCVPYFPSNADEWAKPFSRAAGLSFLSGVFFSVILPIYHLQWIKKFLHLFPSPASPVPTPPLI